MPPHIPVYVISLPESSARRASMDKQAGKLGITPTYSDAVDGRKGEHPLFAKVDKRKRLRYKGRPFKAGELGVWASHYLLWEECVKIDRPMVILEDDAILKPNFAELLTKADKIAEQFPYVRLYGGNMPSKHIQTLEGFNIHRYWKSPMGAVGYLIAPDAAKKLLSKADNWLLPVDDYMDLSWLHGVDCLGIKPDFPVEHASFESTIQTQAPKERLTSRQKLTREGFRYYLRFRYCLDFARRLLH